MSIKCGICGKEFKDGMFNEYSTHVKNCAYEAGLKKKTEDMKKINTELEEVKRAKTVYEGLRDSFREKYPDIYKTNFKDEINNGINKDNKNKRDKKREKYFFNDFIEQEPNIYLHIPDEQYRYIEELVHKIFNNH